jgi:hypothetical protein
VFGFDDMAISPTGDPQLAARFDDCEGRQPENRFGTALELPTSTERRLLQSFFLHDNLLQPARYPSQQRTFDGAVLGGCCYALSRLRQAMLEPL